MRYFIPIVGIVLLVYFLVMLVKSFDIRGYEDERRRRYEREHKRNAYRNAYGTEIAEEDEFEDDIDAWY